VRLRFLRKFDGSLVQVFRAGGRVYFTTRGMIEGARWRFEPGEEDRAAEFDFLGEARRLAEERYPLLLSEPALLEGRTLVFELIHPGSPKVTSYGDRADLVLLAAFDHAPLAYLSYDQVLDLGMAHGLTVVDALAPHGTTFAEQVDALLASWAGTDEEGAVICFERGDEVIYRVKVKSPDYLRLMRLMAFCTYQRTVDLLDAAPQVQNWEGLRALLQEQGNERVPEEVLVFYREHYERFRAYLADLETLRRWAESACAAIDASIGGRAGKEPAAYRKAFAEKAKAWPLAKLIFSHLDGRLGLDQLRKSVRSPEEAQVALAQVAGSLLP
jgi:hypothetical protein